MGPGLKVLRNNIQKILILKGQNIFMFYCKVDYCRFSLDEVYLLV